MDTAKSVTVLLLFCLSSATACQTRKTSPVLEFRPLPKESEGTLLWIQGTSMALIKPWIDSLDSFLEPYYLPQRKTVRMYKCKEQPRPKDAVCEVEPRGFGPCIREANYEYHKASPCIFLRLNDLPKGWRPQLYNTSNVPKEMPDFLKTLLQQEEAEEGGRHNKVWVSCEGENAADKEYIGPVHYYPEAAFPANFYEAAEIEGFLSPLVAVKFERISTYIYISLSRRSCSQRVMYSMGRKYSSRYRGQTWISPF